MNRGSEIQNLAWRKVVERKDTASPYWGKAATSFAQPGLFVSSGNSSRVRANGLESTALKAFGNRISIIAAAEFVPEWSHSSYVVLANVVADKPRGTIDQYDVHAVLVV